MEYKDFKKKSQHGNSTVYLMDCMEALRQTPDNYYSLALVDPPYGIGKNLMTARETTNAMQKFSLTKFRKSFNDKNWDTLPTEEYWNELKRVSKNYIVWGGNYMSDYLPPSKHIIIWDKMTYIPTMSQFEFAFSTLNKHPKLVKINSNDKDRFHPTQKPIKLYEWVLTNYAKEGDLILDTHLGSGSSRIAAYKGGFNFVGFEIDAEYYEKQEKRFNEFKSQLRLF